MPFLPLIRSNRSKQCQRPRVLFGLEGLERNQLALVCGRASLLTGCPGHSGVWIVAVGRKSAGHSKTCLVFCCIQ